MSVVIGIDPGATTGVAVFKDGTLTILDSLKRLSFITQLEILFDDYKAEGKNVIMEDSRMDPFWVDNKSQRVRTALPVMIRAARNLGQVDCMCNLIHELCDEWGVPIICVSPKQKGAKITSHEAFVQMSGWDGRSNQHERDAWLVAHRYRHIRVAG